jgi:hypothetical protein
MASYVGKFCKDDGSGICPQTANEITCNLAKQLLEVANSLSPGDESKAQEIRNAIAGIAGLHKHKEI